MTAAGEVFVDGNGVRLLEGGEVVQPHLLVGHDEVGIIEGLSGPDGESDGDGYSYHPASVTVRWPDCTESYSADENAAGEYVIADLVSA